jgi:hypothetical protein
MGKDRVEAQTDGGLFINVPDPLAQTTLGKSLVWTRSYYVLPLEVFCPFWFASSCPIWSSSYSTHLRQNARSAELGKTAS